MKSKQQSRNITSELIDLARERGDGITRDELIRIGYTPEEIDASKDAVAHALLEMKHAA